MNRQAAVEHQAKSAQPLPGYVLQRKCAGSENIYGGGSVDCRTEKLQRNEEGNSGRVGAPPIVHEALRSPGYPLDREARAFMEPRFQYDFSRVRVHTGLRAAESARAVNALAYTVGHDIVFGAGQYAQGTPRGQALLAHELTHVVQQAGAPTGEIVIAKPTEPCEQEANDAATAVQQNRRVSIAQGSTALMRQAVDDHQPHKNIAGKKEDKEEPYTFVWWLKRREYGAAFRQLDRDVQRAGAPVAQYISGYFEPTAKKFEKAATGIDPDTKDTVGPVDRMKSAALGLPSLVTTSMPKKIVGEVAKRHALPYLLEGIRALAGSGPAHDKSSGQPKPDALYVAPVLADPSVIRMIQEEQRKQEKERK